MFDAIVPEERFHFNYKMTKELGKFEPARWMFDDVFAEYHDKDGNFLEQFQTHGFDARVLELYLFAYFNRSGFKVINEHPTPDFIVERYGVMAGVEATTLNPSTSGLLYEHSKPIGELSENELEDYTTNEMCIRYGSVLDAKLKKKYWQKSYMKGLPFIIAVESFNDPDAIFLSSSSLTTYLYGIRDNVETAIDGGIRTKRKKYTEHSICSKVIGSRFFENAPKELSAILFTNSGTLGKFNRMGYAHGKCNDRLLIHRAGYFLDNRPASLFPCYLSYDLDNPPFTEDWGQGSVIFHNPYAKHNLPDSVFSDLMQCRLIDGELRHEMGHIVPYATTTRTEEVDPELKAFFKQLTIPRCCLLALPPEDIRHLKHIGEDLSNYFQCGWFTDQTDSFCGVLFQHKITERVKFYILGLNKYQKFIPVYRSMEFDHWHSAKDAMYHQLSKMINQPQRYWDENAT